MTQHGGSPFMNSCKYRKCYFSVKIIIVRVKIPLLASASSDSNGTQVGAQEEIKEEAIYPTGVWHSHIQNQHLASHPGDTLEPSVPVYMPRNHWSIGNSGRGKHTILVVGARHASLSQCQLAFINLYLNPYYREWTKTKYIF